MLYRGHLYRPAEGTRHAKAHIVNQYDQYIRCAFRCLNLEARRRCGITGIKHFTVRIVRLRNRQHAAVKGSVFGDGCHIGKKHRQHEAEDVRHRKLSH